MSINVDIDKLKSFVAVGEELHFTRAAQNRLHVSQPWLSRSVKSLEDKLGVQLFERHSRHVQLTAPGRRLLYGARRIVHDFDRTVSAVVRDRRGNGHVTVGYSPYVDLLQQWSCGPNEKSFNFSLVLLVGYHVEREVLEFEHLCFLPLNQSGEYVPTADIAWAAHRVMCQVNASSGHVLALHVFLDRVNRLEGQFFANNAKEPLCASGASACIDSPASHGPLTVPPDPLNDNGFNRCPFRHSLVLVKGHRPDFVSDGSGVGS
jgi:hypothetical protein